MLRRGRVNSTSVTCDHTEAHTQHRCDGQRSRQTTPPSLVAGGCPARGARSCGVSRRLSLLLPRRQQPELAPRLEHNLEARYGGDYPLYARLRVSARRRFRRLCARRRRSMINPQRAFAVSHGAARAAHAPKARWRARRRWRRRRRGAGRRSKRRRQPRRVTRQPRRVTGLRGRAVSGVDTAKSCGLHHRCVKARHRATHHARTTAATHACVASRTRGRGTRAASRRTAGGSGGLREGKAK